ncbi:PAS domain-containing sensor histidine kinase [Edaphobacter sp. 12200R-103]|uniref:PAS domain-containing sensor histidine kinase n=1 Tax=Edaphobacter sp. 12200R-103 TaxID=2703788 RepID=UPI00138C3DD9|nr:PAS domain-containing sensor histidine kinase [Edaphobacter sp. 12200R-103]QHS50981.1 PAS domain-containing sensor histidine kinase [Edaphobacter sp. 12200R-103]
MSSFQDENRQDVQSKLPYVGNSQRWLASVVEFSDDAIISETLDGIVRSWNKGAERIFGYSAPEAIGRSISFLAWPGCEEDMVQLIAMIRRGERVDHYETIKKHKDGRPIDVSLALAGISDADGNVIGISKISRDISSRKATEARFRELIENAPDAILQVDPDGTIVVANRTAETMFGYSREELLGANVDILVPIKAKTVHMKHRASFAGSPKIRPMGSGMELSALRKDGIEVPVEISLSPSYQQAGVNVTAVIRDVSERRQAELQMRSLQKNYMAELEARQKEAETSNRLKSEFLASMSHELRTPLHTIIGFADLLSEESDGPLNDKQRRFLRHIQEDSEHLLGLINDVLDFSKIEAGGMSLRIEKVHLADEISDAVNAIRPRAAMKSLDLKIQEVFSGLVAVDPMRLKEVFYNLLSNAVKFTPENGKITVQTEEDDQFVHVTVADSGIGIPEDQLERAFEKFYQVGYATGGVREGTGLGLAICKRLIEMHGGKIWIDSSEGAGSRFHFTIPKAV